MKIRWAAKQLKKGRKVRRACWPRGVYIYKSGHTHGVLPGGAGMELLSPTPLGVYDLLANNWELYKGDSHED